ncbi:MarR family transcriptional regulator [Kitasatospora sp. NPDC051914]|uniref:MarR family winged helix-turn-helix transcriptional regulator n=1 Tax=Kitasatospora sp. NPDC051914 TaxID=3154945 RepID=UPI00341DD337
MPGTADPTDRPIGYWLKHLHNLLEACFEEALADLGVRRRQWQALNTLAAGPCTPADLALALAPFWPDAAAGVDDLLHGPDGLLPRGWAEPAGAGAVALTADGRRLHGEVHGRVARLRAASLAGLTSEQYAGTVRVLAAMAANLEDPAPAVA